MAETEKMSREGRRCRRHRSSSSRGRCPGGNSRARGWTWTTAACWPARRPTARSLTWRRPSTTTRGTWPRSSSSASGTKSRASRARSGTPASATSSPGAPCLRGPGRPRCWPSAPPSRRPPARPSTSCSSTGTGPARTTWASTRTPSPSWTPPRPSPPCRWASRATSYSSTATPGSRGPTSATSHQLKSNWSTGPCC